MDESGEDGRAVDDKMVPDYMEYLNACSCTCPCMDLDISKTSDHGPNAERKRLILNTVARTEDYLREHRISELVQYLFTKLLAHTPDHPVGYLEKVLDECMLYRAGHGTAPVIYDECHLKAVINSFDPSKMGWLNSIQVQKVFITLGLTLDTEPGEKTSTSDVLDMVRLKQDEELLNLLCAGVDKNDTSTYDFSV